MLRCFLGFGLVFAGLLWVAGCADQEEGQRCDPLNGNNDCAAGLVCVRADKLALVEVGAVCCPPAGEDENAVKECRAELQASDGGNTVLPIADAGGASTMLDAANDATP